MHTRWPLEIPPLGQPRRFNGSPGSSVVGVACLGVLGSGAFNNAIGLPGAYRIRQNIRFENGFCADGVTPFVPPGGSNCP